MGERPPGVLEGESEPGEGSTPRHLRGRGQGPWGSPREIAVQDQEPRVVPAGPAAVAVCCGRKCVPPHTHPLKPIFQCDWIWGQAWRGRKG